MGIEILTDVVVIDKLYILEKFRGKKIGKHSIEFVFKQAEKFNILKIELTVHRDNENSIKVYTYFGFNIIMTLVHELKIRSTLYGFRMQKLL